jgi:Tfp pilus assembly protein PilF
MIHNDRGIAHLMLEQPQAAIADFTQAIQANPQDTRAFFNRGCVYHRQGNLIAAQDDFTQVTRLDPQYAEAYLNRGLIYQQLGHPVKAIAALQQAAQYFREQGLILPYQQTMSLIEKIRSPSLAVG